MKSSISGICDNKIKTYQIATGMVISNEVLVLPLDYTMIEYD